MFAAIGRFAYRRRRWVLGVWVAVFAAALVASTRLPQQLKGGGFSNPDAPSARALALLQRQLPRGGSQLILVFESDNLDARGARFESGMRGALSGMRRSLPDLRSIQTYASTGDPSLVSGDGHAALAVLVFDSTMEKVQAEIGKVRAAIGRTGLKTYLTGDPAVYDDMERISAVDLRRAETWALPLALVVLLLVFGTLVAAALPVIGGAMAVTVTLGVLWVLGHFTDRSIFVLNVASLMGLGVGIDYSLFMVGRFREELATGRDIGAAVEHTVARAGRAIFFSGLAVVIGLLGLMSFPYMALRSIGLGGAVVVFFSVAAALTLLPALLGVLGPRVNSLRVFYRPGREGRFWRRWSEVVMRHAWLVLAGTVAVITPIAWPVARIQVDIPSAASLPTNAESRKGYDILLSRFDLGTLSPIEVVLTWDGGRSADPFTLANLATLWGFGRQLQEEAGVARVTSVVTVPGVGDPLSTLLLWQLVRQGGGAAGQGGAGLGPSQLQAARRLAAATTAPGIALFRVAPSAPPTSGAAQQLVDRIRSLTPPPGARLWVAGLSAGVRDYARALSGRFPWIILFVLVVTYAVLLVLLRSALLPLKAVVVNGLSLLASYGVLVWVFQFGHLEWLLHFESTGTVDADLPVLLFCTVFGVSMDYEVFLLTRVREEWLKAGDNRISVSAGLARTGRIITSAALIVVVVAGSFAFASVLVVKAIGVGLAVAVALDATVIRVLLVPAVMRLLGAWNWWLPARLDRWLPHAAGD